ncbi:MAG TPA: hypothetical protein ENN38_03900 [Actinobacteria bacterium]|nr:hypothetical protein [Actinomycetota bacterium]
MNISEKLFGSKVRAKILEVIFSNAEIKYYGRLLQKTTGLDHKAIWKELNFLEKIGFLASESDGRLKRYRIVPFPGSEDLAKFILKSNKKMGITKKRLRGKPKKIKNDAHQYKKSLEKAKQLMLELDGL